MKLARYTVNGATQIGVVLGDQVIPMTNVLPGAPASIKEIITLGTPWLAKIAEGLKSVKGGIALTSVVLEAPIPDPQKYMAIGMNYKDHVEEARKAGMKIPETQVWFNKQVSCITGPYHDVHKPKVSDRMDYEAEMGVVIGKRCRHVSYEDALSVIGGYCVTNDVTARDWQLASPTFTLGKSFDTHGPIGPWIVTPDEIPDPHALEMRMYVNGEQRQKAITGDMVYNIFQQIEHLSKVMTLEPGDLIATGTCAGVGIALSPPKFIQVGDVMRVEIEGLGYIENRVIAEP